MKKIIFVAFVCIAILLSSNIYAGESGDVETTVLAKSDSSWDGRQLPDYPKGKPEISVLKVVIPPGEQLKPHEHPVINAGILTKGELTVTTKDNKVLRLKPGDALIEVVNTLHYGKNEGDIPAEIIVFYAGTPGVPITIKK